VFLDLLELHSQDAEHTEGELMNSFKVHGLHEEYINLRITEEK
jgi:hypothetical protein